MSSSRMWYISGANTGLGLELALKALQEGDKVIAAVRSLSNTPEVLKQFDVQVLQFNLNVLVNNAAYAYMGAIEKSEDAEVKAQFDTNVFAVLRLIRSMVPHFRTQGNETIMNLSSLSGLRGYTSNGIYCATKFAIEGLTQSLAMEVAPFGISAVIVEPGYFRTSLTPKTVEEYAGILGNIDCDEGE
ncbi:hypothetical protein BP6252_13968 [Coleophoma cylindrospora]|uniref:Uncharacterized protein n=1 Tax=Coleophoma cylindrospora TaxID=1849047 RepID=A0A3D8Q5U3_9HELO|nr:hypothetical protein BP6252_13968 [Coleophoma cylindrospora]